MDNHRVPTWDAPFSNSLLGRNCWKFYKDSAEEWRWTVHDLNGEALFASTEGYTRYSDALACATRAGWSSACRTENDEEA